MKIERLLRKNLAVNLINSKSLRVFTLLVVLNFSVAPSIAASATQHEFKKVQQLLLNKHVDEARRRLRYLCQLPDATPDMYCVLADTYLDMEGVDDDSQACAQAMQGLQIALQKDPNYGRCYGIQATMANLKGQYAQAIKFATKALSVSEPWDEALRQRALAYSHTGHLDDAIKDVQLFITKNHQTSINYMLLGDLQSAVKHYPEAEGSYRLALSKSHVYEARSFNQLLKCLSLEGKNKEAISEVTKMLTQDPGNSELLDTRGQLQVKDKKYKEALADYSRAISGSPIAMYYEHRATAYDALGQKPQADADRLKAKTSGSGDFNGF